MYYHRFTARILYGKWAIWRYLYRKHPQIYEGVKKYKYLNAEAHRSGTYLKVDQYVEFNPRRVVSCPDK